MTAEFHELLLMIVVSLLNSGHNASSLLFMSWSLPFKPACLVLQMVAHSTARVTPRFDTRNKNKIQVVFCGQICCCCIFHCPGSNYFCELAHEWSFRAQHYLLTRSILPVKWTFWRLFFARFPRDWYHIVPPLLNFGLELSRWHL